MRIPMPVQREEIRLALEAAMLKVCGLDNDLGVIHNEIVGNVVEVSIRLPGAGWPFAELCQKLVVSNFVAFHAAMLKCLILAKNLEDGRKQKLEALLVERNFGDAFALMDSIVAQMREREKDSFALREKAEGLYLRPELRVALYIVLNPKGKFIFNMQSSLASDLSLVRAKEFPRTCAAVPTISDVKDLILIHLAQIRPDIVKWLDRKGLEILRKQRFKGWRGPMPEMPGRDAGAF